MSRDLIGPSLSIESFEPEQLSRRAWHSKCEEYQLPTPTGEFIPTFVHGLSFRELTDIKIDIDYYNEVVIKDSKTNKYFQDALLRIYTLIYACRRHPGSEERTIILNGNRDYNTIQWLMDNISGDLINEIINMVHHLSLIDFRPPREMLPESKDKETTTKTVQQNIIEMANDPQTIATWSGLYLQMCGKSIEDDQQLAGKVLNALVRMRDFQDMLQLQASIYLQTKMALGDDHED